MRFFSRGLLIRVCLPFSTYRLKIRGKVSKVIIFLYLLLRDKNNEIFVHKDILKIQFFF